MVIGHIRPLKTAAAFMAVALFAFAPAIVTAGEDGGKPEVFGDWTSSCTQRPGEGSDGGAKSCEISTRISLPGADGRTTLNTMLNIRRSGEDGYVMTFRMPDYVWLPHGLLLKDSKSEQLARLDFLVCGNGLCDAGAEIGQDVIERLSEEAEEARLYYRTKSDQVVRVGFSMTGFADAAGSAFSPGQ